MSVVGLPKKYRSVTRMPFRAVTKPLQPFSHNSRQLYCGSENAI